MELRKKICKPQIIRAFLLEKGDIFNIYGHRCIVAKVTRKEIFYFIIYDYTKTSSYKNTMSVGIDSSQKVELLFSECEYYLFVN